MLRKKSWKVKNESQPKAEEEDFFSLCSFEKHSWNVGYKTQTNPAEEDFLNSAWFVTSQLRIKEYPLHYWYDTAFK